MRTHLRARKPAGRANDQEISTDIIDPPGAPVKGDPEAPAPDPGAFTPSDEDVEWATRALNEYAADYFVDDPKGSDLDALTAELHAFLDTLEPTPEELGGRDRADAFLGHD